MGLFPAKEERFDQGDDRETSGNPGGEESGAALAAEAVLQFR